MIEAPQPHTQRGQHLCIPFGARDRRIAAARVVGHLAVTPHERSGGRCGSRSSTTTSSWSSASPPCSRPYRDRIQRRGARQPSLPVLERRRRDPLRHLRRRCRATAVDVEYLVHGGDGQGRHLQLEPRTTSWSRDSLERGRRRLPVEGDGRRGAGRGRSSRSTRVGRWSPGPVAPSAPRRTAPSPGRNRDSPSASPRSWR